MLARVNWMKIRIIRQYVLYGLIHVLEWTAVSRAADMYRCHACEHLNVVGWEICVSGTSTRGNTRTSTRVLVLVEYSILLCTMCIMGAKGRQMTVTLET